MSRWLLGAFLAPPLLLTVCLVLSRSLLGEDSDWLGVAQLSAFVLSAGLGAGCIWRLLPRPASARAAITVLYVLLAGFALSWYVLLFGGLIYDSYL